MMPFAAPRKMVENGGRFNAQPAPDTKDCPKDALMPTDVLPTEPCLPKWLLAVPPARPVLIAGPTASGKSGLALALARAQGRAVVNADALQVYDNWRVLTARPSVEETAQAPHFLYGHIGATQSYSVGHWLRDLADILASQQPVVIVGGTGLYFSALTAGLVDIPAIAPEVRAQSAARHAEIGLAGMVADLDAATAAQIDTANPARVLRAWEVLQATGRGLAAWQADTGAPLLALGSSCALVLQPQPDWLAARIDARFDHMIANGALDEARAALQHWEPNQPSAKAIGAPELVAHLRGDIPLSEAIARAKLASRQYAKRQRTWFRSRMKDWHPLDPETLT